MKKAFLVLYISLLLLLSLATIIEKYAGSAFVNSTIYHSSWFFALWAVIVVLSLFIMFRQQMWKRLSVFMLHFSFVMILLGAIITFFTGEKGYLHLIVGEKVSSFVEQDSHRVLDLPFALQLDSFRIKYYPGTQAPSDYVSYIHDYPPVSMNRILNIQGYRFYQSSFDQNGQGSWLSVNYDPWGISITYAGYMMLIFSMLYLLWDKKGGFRRLLQHPLFKKGTFSLLFFLLGINTLLGADNPLPTLTCSQADSLAQTQVLYNGRVAPFNTLARDFVLKITGETQYKGLTPEQIVGGWLLYPDSWKEEPFILIKNTELRQRLGMTGKYARFAELFSDGKYLLPTLNAYGTEGAYSSKWQKAVAEVDEKVALILMLQNGTLVQPLPQDSLIKPLSECRLHAEIWYNNLPFTKFLFVFCLTLGLLSFVYLLCASLRSIPKKLSEWMNKGFVICLYLAFFCQLSVYLLRWYVSGRIPLSNGYETMQFLALATLTVAVFLYKRFPFILSFGFLSAGFTLLVSYLGQLNPQITPLVPVLVSPWLSTHVSLIMLSYALFAFIFFSGILSFILPCEADKLMLFSRLLLYPAVFLLGAGIFIGAVWANVSWGRYWAWDPKEVWALITFMIYGLAFHERLFSLFRQPKFFHGYMIVAFISVLMTYFGVNYFLGGLHGY